MSKDTSTSKMSPQAELNRLIGELDDAVEQHGIDYGVRLEVAHECAWSAEVRLTPEPNRRDGPDRSLVTFAVGAATAEDATARAVRDALTWLVEEADKAT
jgi:hypothetical protein